MAYQGNAESVRKGWEKLRNKAMRFAASDAVSVSCMIQRDGRLVFSAHTLRTEEQAERYQAFCQTLNDAGIGANSGKVSSLHYEILFSDVALLRTPEGKDKGDLTVQQACDFVDGEIMKLISEIQERFK